MKKHVGEIPPGYAVNRYGYLVKSSEVLDPVPKASSVKFKRPLSAHERVLRAVRVQRQLDAIDAMPGDDTFDSEPIEDKTPHQLMTDPQTGEEMTAGEYVMLQHERAQASRDVQQAAATQLKNKKTKKAATKPPLKDEESEPDSED